MNNNKIFAGEMNKLTLIRLEFLGVPFEFDWEREDTITPI